MRTQRPKILTTGEMAFFLKVSCDTIRRWTRDGIIPALEGPCGRARRYVVADVVKALQRKGGDK
jgi:excisionase family DNA binding protein